MLERQNQKIKPRGQAVRGFPHPQSLLRLTAARMMETNQESMGRINPCVEEEPETATETIAKAARGMGIYRTFRT